MRSRSAGEPGALGVVDRGGAAGVGAAGHDVLSTRIRSGSLPRRYRTTRLTKTGGPRGSNDRGRSASCPHARSARVAIAAVGRLRRRPGDRRHLQPQDRRGRRPGRGHGHLHLPDHLHAARRRAQGARQAGGSDPDHHRRGGEPLHGLLPAVGGQGAEPTCRTRSARSSRRCSAPLWRITIASIVAEVVSELVDTEVYHWFVRRVTTRYQWARVAASNAVSMPDRQRALRGAGLRRASRASRITPSRCRGSAVWEIFIVNLTVKGLVSAVSLPLIYLTPGPRLVGRRGRRVTVSPSRRRARR